MPPRGSGDERILPTYPGEAGEVGVGAVDDGAVFQGEGGDLGVGDEVAAGAGFGEEAADRFYVAWAGDKEADVGASQPRGDVLAGFADGQRVFEDFAVGGQPQEREDDDGAEPDGFDVGE